MTDDAAGFHIASGCWCYCHCRRCCCYFAVRFLSAYTIFCDLWTWLLCHFFVRSLARILCVCVGLFVCLCISIRLYRSLFNDCVCVWDVGKTRCGRRSLLKSANERALPNLTLSLCFSIHLSVWTPEICIPMQTNYETNISLKMREKSSQRLRLKNRLNVFLLFFPLFTLASIVVVS